MLNFQEYKNSINEAKGDQYGCLMLYFDVKNWDEYTSLIDSDDTHEYGIEDNPHVTILYGFDQSVSADNFKNLLVTELSASEIGKDLKVENISKFENPEFDVLKFDLESSRLRMANLMVKMEPHTSTFPTYSPHLTLAYLQPGLADSYISKIDDLELKMSNFRFVYSDKDSNKTTF